MGFTEDMARSLLDGPMGKRLENMTEASKEVVRALNNGVKTVEKVIQLGERIEKKLDTILTRLEPR